MNGTTAAALLPTRITVEDVSDKYGISQSTVRAAYHKGWLRGAPPRGPSWPVLFSLEDVEHWVSGEPPVERDDDAWRCLAWRGSRPPAG